MAKKKAGIKVEIPPTNESKGMLEKLGVAKPQDLATQIHTDFLNAEQTKYLWIPQRSEDVKNYYGVTPNAEWPFKGASRVKSQFQRIVVDTFAGNLVKSIFLPEHPISALPAPLSDKSSSDTLDNIRYVEDLHNSIAFNEYDLRSVLDKALSTSLIESFVVLSPVYEYLTSEIVVSVTRWVPGEYKDGDLTYDLDTDTVEVKSTGEFVHSVSMESNYMTEDEAKKAGLRPVTFDVTKEECVKDGISIKQINGYRFYMPLGTPGETPYEKVQRAPYVVHQLFYTIKEVKQYQEQGYFENIEPVIASVYDRQRELITYQKLQQAGFLLDTARLEYEYVEVLKWCGKWKIDGKWRELIVWMDRSSTQILRVEPNVTGVRPFFPVVPFPVDETPYGESLCQIIRPLVKELDLLLRMLSNMAIMKAAPPKFYDPASGFNPQTIGNFGPNSWIPAREPAKNVLIPPQPEDPQISFQLIQLYINILERITGINEVVQGNISNKANTTATEVQNALVRSGVRFDQVYERIKGQLKPMFRYIHKLMLRHMPETKEVRLMGADNANRLVKIHKGMLQGNFEFELSGNSVVTEQNELQNALALYNTIGQHPYTTYKPESIYYILYNIVKRLNPIAKDKILPKPEEIAAIERQNQIAQRQQEEMAAQQQSSQPDPAQMQAQQQAQMAQQEMNTKSVEDQQKLVHNEAAHKQQLRHNDEKHLQEMALMHQKMLAEQQQSELQIAQMKARAYAERKTVEKQENP